MNDIRNVDVHDTQFLRKSSWKKRIHERKLISELDRTVFLKFRRAVVETSTATLHSVVGLHELAR